MTTLTLKLSSMPPKKKKIIFFSIIIFDSLLKLSFLSLFFFSNSSFFIFLFLLFLILVTVLIWGLLRNYKWVYMLLISYGIITIILCSLVAFSFLFLSFSPPFGSSEFIPTTFIIGLAFLLACIPTIIMIVLARGYKVQADIDRK